VGTRPRHQTVRPCQGLKTSFRTCHAFVQQRPHRVFGVHRDGRHTMMRICKGSMMRYTWSIARTQTVIISLVVVDLNFTPYVRLRSADAT